MGTSSGWTTRSSATPPPSASTPNFADAFSNLASAYKDGGRIDDAITCYRKALSLKPDFPDALANFIHSLVFVCDWRNRASDFSKLSKMLDQQIARENCVPSV